MAFRNRHAGADSTPPQAAVDEESMVVSVEGKGAQDVSGVNQEGER